MNSEWWRGDAQGKHGIFPNNFVVLESGNVEAFPIESAQQQQQSNFGTLTALYDYSSGVSDDLEFKANDIIQVISKTQSLEWVMGKLGNKTGLVPMTYVREN